MAVEYNQHTWGYGEELTPDRLNNIEGGVKANADAINEVNNNLARSRLAQMRFQTKRRTDGNEVAEFNSIDTTQYIAFVLTNTGDILLPKKILSDSSFAFDWSEDKGNIGLVIVAEY